MSETTIGEKLKIARKRAGLTQKELAKRLGISPQNIHAYETGRRNPKRQRIAEFAEKLNVPVSYFYDFEACPGDCGLCDIVIEHVRRISEAIETVKRGEMPGGRLRLSTDQEEVVRCKDCKNWDTTWQNDWAKNYHYCPIVDGMRNGNWYCAGAERK